MKLIHKIIIFLGFAFTGIALAAPTSTIVQNLKITNVTSSLLSTDSTGLVVATTTSNLVPYTGATADVDLGAFNLTGTTLTGTNVRFGAGQFALITEIGRAHV